jgi:hypothetical protein
VTANPIEGAGEYLFACGKPVSVLLNLAVPFRIFSMRTTVPQPA